MSTAWSSGREERRKLRRAPRGPGLLVASQDGQVEVVRLLLARQDVEVNKADSDGFTALMLVSYWGHVEVVRLLLAHPEVEADRTSNDGRSALCLASQRGHGAIVSLLVAHRAHGQVRLLAADAIDSLPAGLLKEFPGVAAQAAALRLPLDVALALGDTEEERAAADDLASQSAWFEALNAQLAAAAVQTPRELARAREALARAPARSPSDVAARAAWEREADAALRAAMTTTAFRGSHRLIVRKMTRKAPASGRALAARQEQRRPAPDMLYVVGLGLGDNKDNTVKGLWPSWGRARRSTRL